MYSNHKIYENILKEIVFNITKCINPNDKLKLIVYYKNKKSSNLVIKNNMPVNNFLCKFLVLKNYIRNFISFLTNTLLGTYIDHLEFTVSPAVIFLFLKNYQRYLNSVLTKRLLSAYSL